MAKQPTPIGVATAQGGMWYKLPALVPTTEYVAAGRGDRPHGTEIEVENLEGQHRLGYFGDAYRVPYDGFQYRVVFPSRPCRERTPEPRKISGMDMLQYCGAETANSLVCPRCRSPQAALRHGHYEMDGFRLTYVAGDLVHVEGKGVRIYFYKGQPHRRGGPAFISATREEWWVAGRRHRRDGPAVITARGWEWWVGGLRHHPVRQGPAVAYRGVVPPERTNLGGAPTILQQWGDRLECWVDGVCVGDSEPDTRLQITPDAAQRLADGGYDVARWLDGRPINMRLWQLGVRYSIFNGRVQVPGLDSARSGELPWSPRYAMNAREVVVCS